MALLGLGVQVHLICLVFAPPIFHVSRECVDLPLDPQVQDLLQLLLARQSNLLPQRTGVWATWFGVGVQVGDHPAFQGQRGLFHLELLEVVFYELDGLRQQEGEQAHEGCLVLVEVDDLVRVLVVLCNVCIDDGGVDRALRTDDLTPLLSPQQRIWSWPLDEDLFGGHGILQLTLRIPGRWVIDGLDLEQSMYLRRACNNGLVAHRPIAA